MYFLNSIKNKTVSYDTLYKHNVNNFDEKHNSEGSNAECYSFKIQLISAALSVSNFLGLPEVLLS